MQRIYKIIYDLKKKYKCNIVFDTRLLKKNDIFIGLKTKNNDGNKYYSEAVKKKSLDPYHKIMIPKAKRILIQSIRHIKKSIYLNQNDIGRNIVIIFDAELLCEGQGESGNALLKILEESTLYISCTY